MPYPWAVGDVLHAVDLNAAIAAGPVLPAAAGIAGYLFGLTLSNDVGTPNTLLDVSAGACADSAGAVNIVLGAFTKSISGAWAAGSGQNGMGAGLTIAATTWYHVFACINAGVSDMFFDTLATGAHAPIGTTSFRRIGSFKTDGAAHIVGFQQFGERFTLASPSVDYNGVPGVTTGALLTLAGVPTGIVTQAILGGYVNDAAAGGAAYLSSPFQPDVAAGLLNATVFETGAGASAYSSFNCTLLTDSSARIRRRVSTTTMALVVMTLGYLDQRGRLS